MGAYEYMLTDYIINFQRYNLKEEKHRTMTSDRLVLCFPFGPTPAQTLSTPLDSTGLAKGHKRLLTAGKRIWGSSGGAREAITTDVGLFSKNGSNKGVVTSSICTKLSVLRLISLPSVVSLEALGNPAITPPASQLRRSLSLPSGTG